MNSITIKNTIRILILILFQIFVLKEISLFDDKFRYIEIIIYPVAILLLPLSTPRFFLLLIAFIAGISVDIFYNSLGVHAAAMLWMAYSRPYILKFLEPKSGYTIHQHPVAHELGIFWFMQYLALALIIFMFSYFCMRIFTFVYLWSILSRTVISFFLSYFILFLIQIIFNPKS